MSVQAKSCIDLNLTGVSRHGKKNTSVALLKTIRTKATVPAGRLDGFQDFK
jgi:hypothetical protein